jgi:hypothetical protein
MIVMTLGVLIGGASLFGGDGQTTPSRYYLQDDIQYFPPGAEMRLEATSRKPRAALGDLLLTGRCVRTLHRSGHPANPDGSLGGLAAGDDGTEMRVYERYIVVDATDADGTTFRTLHAYETIGKMEQRIPREKTRAKQHVR